MAVCLPPPSFELMDCQGTVLRHVPTACLDEQMLKDLAQIFESDKRSKLVAECPEFGMPGASAYLALVGGDYNRAREEILAVHQCFKEQTAQHVHQLEAALQDAQQAKEQAEVERDGAVAEKDSAIAESVQLTLQKDEYENMVQDLVKENVAFKAETALANIKLRSMEAKSNKLQREYQDVHGYIATLEQEHYGKLAECRAQVENLQGIVADLRSEAAADMGDRVEVVQLRGVVDDKQQEIESLRSRLAHSQTRVQHQGCVLDRTRTQLQETQFELWASQGRLQALQHELSHTQERLQGRVDHLEAKVERTTSKWLQMMNRCWETEGQYHKSEETLATLRRAVDADLARRSKRFDNMFDRLYKEKLDLIGENELLKHEHAALEENLETMQRELNISNQWYSEAIGELDKVTDELTLFKETFHAQGIRLLNGDPFDVSPSPLGLEEWPFLSV